MITTIDIIAIQSSSPFKRRVVHSQWQILQQTGFQLHNSYQLKLYFRPQSIDKNVQISMYGKINTIYSKISVISA